jgi:hypothetical protein
MDEELVRNYQLWREADEEGRDDVADAAFGVVFKAAAPEPGVSAGFATRTMETIAVSAAADARRVRRMRAAIAWGTLLGVAAMAYLGAGLIASAVSATATAFVNVTIGTIVGLATGRHAGADIWRVLSGVGRTAESFAADPTITLALVVLQGIAITALIALQRLLRSAEESFK